MRHWSDDLPSISFDSRVVHLDSGLTDDPLHIFHGICEADDQRWCTTRVISKNDWINSRVHLDGIDLDYGEDPRIFLYLGKPAIVAAVYQSGYGFRNHLFEVDGSGVARCIILLPSAIPAGKNWSPFIYQDHSLGMVHSFDPPLILKQVRREIGVIVMEAHRGVGATRGEMGPGGFSAYRGGSNGLTVGDFVLGIGHTTRFCRGRSDSNFAELGFDHLHHRPFGWILDPLTNDIRTFDVTGPFPEEFDIIDPTSLIRQPDGSCEVFTTEVSRHFHDPAGRRQVASYRFEISPAFLAQASLSFSTRTLDAQSFMSSVTTLVDSEWRIDLAGRSGHVISGPYITLPRGCYQAIFDFSSADLGDNGVLELEVVSNASRFLALRVLNAADTLSDDARTMLFDHTHEAEAIEFRIAVRDFPQGSICFRGVKYRASGA